MKLILNALTLVLVSSTLLAQGGPPPPPPGGGPAPPPPGNQITPEKALLGKALFWDEQLSSTGLTACATCHIPSAGGQDPRSFQNPLSLNPGPDGLLGTQDDVGGSIGVIESAADGSYLSSTLFGLRRQVTTRQAPTMINSAFFPQGLFWDGRADGSFEDPLTGALIFPAGAAIESQVAEPPNSASEMGHVGRDWADVAAKIAASQPLDYASQIPTDLANFIAGKSYPELFTQVFGTPDVTPVRIIFAIATYERTLLSLQSRFDDFVAGVPGAFTPQEQQGLQIFNGPAGCNLCHVGQVQSDGLFHNIGVRPDHEDLGRFVVTGNPADRGRFKTPSLRNVELSAPYFHNGQFNTLEEVVEFYDRGGDFQSPNHDPRIVPLGLSVGQKAALVAFMKALTDERVRNELPPFDRPQLYTESNHIPTHYGAPTAGTGGFAPRMVAMEPPRIGNSNMTLGIERGLGGNQAILAISHNQDLAGTVFQGSTLHIGLTGGVQLHRIPALQGSGAGQGFGSVNLDVPLDFGLVGSSVFAQWFVFDLGAPIRFSASDAVQISYY
jgi:cytochrome c peroxidase